MTRQWRAAWILNWTFDSWPRSKTSKIRTSFFPRCAWWNWKDIQNYYNTMLLEFSWKAIVSSCVIDSCSSIAGWRKCSALRPSIHISVHSKSTGSADAYSQLAEELVGPAPVIWHELVMTHSHNAGVVDWSLKDIVLSTLPYRGIPELFIGDFRQIPPFVQAGNRSQIFSACFKRSCLFQLFKPLHPQKICVHKLFAMTWTQTLQLCNFPHIF